MLKICKLKIEKYGFEFIGGENSIDKLVGFDGKKYFVDLTKLTGETVTVNYRQK